MRQWTTPAALLILSLNPALAGAAESAPAGAFGLSDARLGMRVAPVLLLSRPDVRAELGLDADQVAAADRAIADLYRQAEALRGRPNTPETIAARRAIDQMQQRWLAEALTEAQLTRLLQLDLQWEGPAALATRPAVAETLGLAAQQVQAITNALAECRRAGGTAEAQHQLAARALAALDDDQRARWKAMLGTPLAFRATAQAPPATARN